MEVIRADSGGARDRTEVDPRRTDSGPGADRPSTSGPRPTRAGAVLALQRSAGNQAVTTALEPLVQRQSHEPEGRALATPDDIANRYATMNGGAPGRAGRVAAEMERRERLLAPIRARAELQADLQWRSEQFAAYLNQRHVQPRNLGTERATTETRFQIAWDAGAGQWRSTRILQLEDNPAAREAFVRRYQEQSHSLAVIEWVGAVAAVAATVAAAGAVRLVANRVVAAAPLLTETEGAAMVAQARAGLSRTASRANVAAFRSEIDGVANGGWALAGEAPGRNPAGSVPSPMALPRQAPARMYLGGPVDTDRAYDAERKVLQTLLDQTTAASRGRVVLYTERTMCGQCATFLEQFRAQRPNISVNVVGGGPIGAAVPGTAQTNQGLAAFDYPGQPGPPPANPPPPPTSPPRRP